MVCADGSLSTVPFTNRSACLQLQRSRSTDKHRRQGSCVRSRCGNRHWWRAYMAAGSSTCVVVCVLIINACLSFVQVINLSVSFTRTVYVACHCASLSRRTVPSKNRRAVDAPRRPAHARLRRALVRSFGVARISDLPKDKQSKQPHVIYDQVEPERVIQLWSSWVLRQQTLNRRQKRLRQASAAQNGYVRWDSGYCAPTDKRNKNNSRVQWVRLTVGYLKHAKRRRTHETLGTRQRDAHWSHPRCSCGEAAASCTRALLPLQGRRHW
jgi:hypothetical protein